MGAAPVITRTITTIAGAAERLPATALEAVDESVHVLASAPNLPRR